MSERITVRVDDELCGRLSDAAKARGMDVSSVVRQALIAALDGSHATTPTVPPVHDREACAQTILQGCPLEVRREIANRLLHTGLSLADVLETLLWCSVAPFYHKAVTQGVEPARVLHEALVMWLDRASKAHSSVGSPHSPDDCARAALAHCPPAVQARMAGALGRTGVPLVRLLSVMLERWTDASRTP
jgi:Ribbon-helix-helix protein, copG family